MSGAGTRLEADRISAAHERAEDELLFGVTAQALSADSGSQGFGFENIVGVGITERSRHGQPTGEQCVAVYVAQKAAPEDCDPAAVVPRDYEGIPTDVIEVGELVAGTARARQRPAMSGTSIGNDPHGTTGTLGFLARGGDDVFVVSNNHVLANANAGTRGDILVQPGPADGGGAEDQVATLSRWVALDFDGGANTVDVAVGSTADDVAPADVYGIGPFTPSPVEPRRDLLARKGGRTSGITRGIVVDVTASVRVRYGSRWALLREQTLIAGLDRAFSEPGDSGSLVLDEATRSPIGLLCGGSPRRSIINRIDRVLDELGLSFLT